MVTKNGETAAHWADEADKDLKISGVTPVLNGGTLALVDTDPHVLETMMKLARRAKEFSGAPFELLGSTDRREVMKGADFVVSSFSFRNTHYRGTDVRIARKYGVTMCSGDTIGPPADRL